MLHLGGLKKTNTKTQALKIYTKDTFENFEMFIGASLRATVVDENAMTSKDTGLESQSEGQ